MQEVMEALTLWGGQVVDQYKSIIIDILPIALGILGLIMAVNMGIKFFQDTLSIGGVGCSGSDEWVPQNEWQEQAGISGWYDEDDVYHEINSDWDLFEYKYSMGEAIEGEDFVDASEIEGETYLDEWYDE